MVFVQILERTTNTETGPDKSDPSDIPVEALLNIRTIWALGLIDERLKSYQQSLKRTQRGFRKTSIAVGLTAGVSQGVIALFIGLELMFGGFLLETSSEFLYKDLIASSMAMILAIMGAVLKFQSAQVKGPMQSIRRLLYLLNRESASDPLSVSVVWKDIEAALDAHRPTERRTSGLVSGCVTSPKRRGSAIPFRTLPMHSLRVFIGS